MKAMLWKELRENARWAVLGGLVLALAEFYILGGLQRETPYSERQNITLTHDSFLMVLHFGAALVAGGLAALQILPERPRDRWAALLHRPVSRGVIFGGKAIAGLMLYAAAVALSFVGGVVYVAWPGKFAAPFVPGMMLPGLHALAGGVAYYFGSLLLCLHRGRWLGTRGALLLAVAAVFLLQIDKTGPFLGLPALSAVVLSLAAWHAMLGDSQADRGYWLRRAAFTAVVLFGVQAGLLLVGAGLSLLKPEPTVNFTFTQLTVTQDGQVFKMGSGMNGEGQTVTDMSGRPVTDPRYLGSNSYENFCQFWPLSYGLAAHRRGFFDRTSVLNGVSHVEGIRLGPEAKESWFLLVRQNYLIGYDNLSRRCVGICDREGFKAPGATPVPFAGPLANSFFYTYAGADALFWTDHQLYGVNFFDRRLRLLLDQPDRTLDQVLPLPLGGRSENFRYLVLATEDRFEVLDEQGQPVFERPYLHDPRHWDSLEVATNQSVDRLFLLSQRGFYNPTPKPAGDVACLDELDLHGDILHAYSADIDNTLSPEPGWLTTVQACLLPAAPAVWQHFRHDGVTLPFWAGQKISFEGAVASLDAWGWAAMGLLATVLAAVAFVWVRRMGCPARRAWGWAGFVLAFGPAGLLALRLAGNWPRRVRCPFCAHRRALSEDECPHCRRGWETPPSTGTEIFQPMPV